MILSSHTLHSAISGLKRGEFSPVELLTSCIEAIEKHDGRYHAFLALNPHAKEEAAKYSRSDFDTLPLAGIPIAIKDNFLTRGVTTTASSRVLDGYLPPYDATVVKKLKGAGAILLGKTNMDAWAHGSSTETSDYGPTLNPWNTQHLPGGSSGGSAAAVAADMCIAAIGSETAGSIRQPAAWCGVTGLKPTYGRVSRYGVVAMASSTDSPGPLTKTAEDAELLLRIISGQDPHDSTSSSEKSEFLSSPPHRLRIGLATDYLLPEMKQPVKDLIIGAAEVLRNAGMEFQEVKLIDPHYAIGVYTIIQRAEVSSNLARYDGIRYGRSRKFFGDEAKRRIMLGTYILTHGYYEQYYNKAQKVRTLIVKDFDEAFKKVDLIIGPTSPGTALKVGASKDQAMFGEMEDILVEPSSIAGLPGISIPCGFIDALPVGLQIIGPKFNEANILYAAKKFQSLTDWHTHKPTYDEK